MARPKKEREEAATVLDVDRFMKLLLSVPTDVFIQMASRALPTASARELCDLFREMKS